MEFWGRKDSDNLTSHSGAHVSDEGAYPVFLQPQTNAGCSGRTVTGIVRVPPEVTSSDVAHQLL